MLACGGGDGGGNEIVGQGCWIGAREVELEEALYQLLERLVEELSPAPCIELLGAVPGRLETEHLPREALERAVGERGEAG